MSTEITELNISSIPKSYLHEFSLNPKECRLRSAFIFLTKELLLSSQITVKTLSLMIQRDETETARILGENTQNTPIEILAEIDRVFLHECFLETYKDKGLCTKYIALSEEYVTKENLLRIIKGIDSKNK